MTDLKLILKKDFVFEYILNLYMFLFEYIEEIGEKFDSGYGLIIFYHYWIFFYCFVNIIKDIKRELYLL